MPNCQWTETPGGTAIFTARKGGKGCKRELFLALVLGESNRVDMFGHHMSYLQRLLQNQWKALKGKFLGSRKLQVKWFGAERTVTIWMFEWHLESRRSMQFQTNADPVGLYTHFQKLKWDERPQLQCSSSNSRPTMFTCKASLAQTTSRKTRHDIMRRSSRTSTRCSGCLS